MKKFLLIALGSTAAVFAAYMLLDGGNVHAQSASHANVQQASTALADVSGQVNVLLSVMNQQNAAAKNASAQLAELKARVQAMQTWSLETPEQRQAAVTALSTYKQQLDVLSGAASALQQARLQAAVMLQGFVSRLQSIRVMLGLA